MEMESSLLSWLLEGDVSVQYQVHRDLLGEDRPDLQARIAQEGWGAAFLSKRRPDGPRVYPSAQVLPLGSNGGGD